MYFHYFVIISPWKKEWPFSYRNFIQGRFVLNLVEYCPVLLEKKILKFRQCFFHDFVIISAWKMGRALHLNKIESSLHKVDLYQVWLKLAEWFWRRRFFKFVNVFSLFCNYPPPWKNEGPSI